MGGVLLRRGRVRCGGDGAGSGEQRGEGLSGLWVTRPSSMIPTPNTFTSARRYGMASVRPHAHSSPFQRGGGMCPASDVGDAFGEDVSGLRVVVRLVRDVVWGLRVSEVMGLTWDRSTWTHAPSRSTGRSHRAGSSARPKQNDPRGSCQCLTWSLKRSPSIARVAPRSARTSCTRTAKPCVGPSGFSSGRVGSQPPRTISNAGRRGGRAGAAVQGAAGTARRARCRRRGVRGVAGLLHKGRSRAHGVRGDTRVAQAPPRPHR
jgi:hypothetical protein